LAACRSAVGVLRAVHLAARGALPEDAELAVRGLVAVPVRLTLRATRIAGDADAVEPVGAIAARTRGVGAVVVAEGARATALRRGVELDLSELVAEDGDRRDGGAQEQRARRKHCR